MTVNSASRSRAIGLLFDKTTPAAGTVGGVVVLETTGADDVTLDPCVVVVVVAVAEVEVMGMGAPLVAAPPWAPEVTVGSPVTWLCSPVGGVVPSLTAQKLRYSSNWSATYALTPPVWVWFLNSSKHSVHPITLS